MLRKISSPWIVFCLLVYASLFACVIHELQWFVSRVLISENISFVAQYKNRMFFYSIVLWEKCNKTFSSKTTCFCPFNTYRCLCKQKNIPMKPQEVKKQMFFPFMDKNGKVHGIIINKLEDGSYLIEQNGVIHSFTFQQLRESPQNDNFVTLPFVAGNNEFGSPYAMTHTTFKRFLEDFTTYFDESISGWFSPVI